ncbi:hypothetical protein [Streptomyces brasiliscabiei]|uniref:hypothetical protein n=1 Tax=Streptomyces brasiliscabiei TaxID=2736302 RepID=UPI001C119286|nr:hypothetical protein [Streptomyces brasiliscabiei]
MKGLVVIDPEAPNGYRRARYGPVVNGRTIASPAMRKLVHGLIRDAGKAQQEKALMDAWVKPERATAPERTVLQEQILRRAKADSIRLAAKNRC